MSSARERCLLRAWAAGNDADVVMPDDAEYRSLRLVYNAMHDPLPRALVRPRTSHAVQSVVRLAAEHELQLTIRGGGHHVAGLSAGHERLVLDLGLMRSVDQVGDCTYAIDGGARLRDVDVRTAVDGRAIPLGTVSATGVGGLVLGGGVGWLLGPYGLACDHVVAADVVGPEGELVHADETMLRAIRGGGGGVGCVTRFYMNAEMLPPVAFGRLVYAGTGAPRALKAFVDVAGLLLPEHVTSTAQLTADPREVTCAIEFCSLHDDAGAMAPLLARAGRPAFQDVVRDGDFPRWQMTSDHVHSNRLRGFWKSAYLTDLNAEDTASLLDHATRSPNETSSILVEHLHGAFHRPALPSSFPGRNASFSVLATARWASDRDDARMVAWAREAIESLDGPARVGAYSNYTSEVTGRMPESPASARFSAGHAGLTATCTEGAQ